jgi:hypothetical protein
MPNMYCPQCGRELDLESGDVRFCRYCGLSLDDTKDSLQGYSKQKRVGFSVVAWSFALLLMVALLLHENYIPLHTGWGYWLSALLIVLSVSLFTSAALSALKPALFSKKQSAKGIPEPHGHVYDPLADAQSRGASLPHGEPATYLGESDKREMEIKRPGSVTEGTTRRLG